MMDAIISGRAGKGLLFIEDTFLSFDVGTPNVFLPVQSLNLHFFFGGALDLQVLHNTDAALASSSLRKAYNCVCALDLILISFDPNLSVHVRLKAVAALETLLANGYVIEHLENVLYGRPLPPTADVDTVLNLNGLTNTPIANSFIQTISGYQEAIREVSLAWDAIPLFLFGSEEKRAEFQQVAIREGFFRTIVKRHSFRRKINPSRFSDLLAPSVKAFPKHEEILQRWAENLLKLAGPLESTPDVEMTPAIIFEERNEQTPLLDDAHGQDYKNYSDGGVNSNESDFVDIDAAIGRWQCFPASSLSHHGGRCCEIAREWVLAMDRSQLNGAPALTGPRWLRRKYTWGPSRWPNHWCEAVGEEMLDCGALAALAHEVFTARGVKSFPAQFIQQFTAEDTCHWRERWGDKQCAVNWIEDKLIYHEGCAVVVSGREVKLWDASASWWLNPRRVGGYGGLLAARLITPPADSGEVFRWGTHLIVPNRWSKLKKDTGDGTSGHTPKSAKQHGGY